MILSDINFTNDKSCDMNIKVNLNSIFNLHKSFKIEFCIDLSNAETHSSQLLVWALSSML